MFRSKLLSKAKQHKTNEIGLYFFRHIWVRKLPLTNYCTVLKEGGVEKRSLQWAIYSRLSVGEDDRESGRAACGVSPGSRSSSSSSTFSIILTDGERGTGCGAIGCIYSKIVCNLIPKWLPLWCCVFSFKLLLVASFLNLRFKSTFSLERVNKS